MAAGAEVLLDAAAAVGGVEVGDAGDLGACYSDLGPNPVRIAHRRASSSNILSLKELGVE